MIEIVVLIVLHLGPGFEYNFIQANETFKSSKSCEEKLDKIELDRRRKGSKVFRANEWVLRIDSQKNMKKGDMIMYRCELAGGRQTF
ncbi:MAG: hypothetical protein CBC53_001485 [Alphaproteobacteria bacterium TMED93]|nr:MAG: hypothetical protein CBC53_001485 [Alphaproteobacteria bacterium TMED93]|tara:strand:+ start:3148 stop:3408 length:261 start_codon:yes stop_codon:yes gene_type:complete